MKVKCITPAGHSNFWVETRVFLWLRLGEKKVDGPKEGDIVTVVGEYWDRGECFYLLKEWPTKENEGWNSNCFVPIEPAFEKISYNEIKKENPVGVN